MPGGGDAGSLLPGVLPPELGASRNEPGQTRRCLNDPYHLHHLSLEWVQLRERKAVKTYWNRRTRLEGTAWC